MFWMVVLVCVLVLLVGFGFDWVCWISMGLV